MACFDLESAVAAQMFMSAGYAAAAFMMSIFSLFLGAFSSYLSNGTARSYPLSGGCRPWCTQPEGCFQACSGWLQRAL